MFAPKMTRVLLSRDPTYGVYDIALATTIGPYYGRRLCAEIEDNTVDKRLETLDAEFFYSHGISPEKRSENEVVYFVES